LITHLPSFFKLVLGLVKDRRVSFRAKLLFVATLSYVLLPTDLLPDFLVDLGRIDDLGGCADWAKIFSPALS
jgi:uncharacterized membrane protein YkvA (DUF1232 family)